ncbi:MAG: CcdB family protein [Burkholderiales bacterium]|nr:CcdB family protein [Burkholderiales bacterium]
MAQWDVFPNPAPSSRDSIPYLVVLQSDLLDRLPTRLVAPLSRSDVAAAVLPQRMAPAFRIRGERLVLKAHEAVIVPARSLRQPVYNLHEESHRLVDALGAVIGSV